MMNNKVITLRMKTEWERALNAELKSDYFDRQYLDWAHSMGFLAESACAYGLSDSNIHRYISDFDYASLWPLNSWQRIWINDKLTLRFVLDGTKWGSLLPDYYFYTENGAVSSLPNVNYENSVFGLTSCLRAKRELACKPCNGAQSRGFHKLTYDSDSDDYYIDNMLLSDAAQIKEFITSHQNYVITEYIHPVNYLADIHPLIHTLRVLVARIDGAFEILGAYLRFGLTNMQGNYSIPGADVFNYTVGVDIDTGEFGHGKMVYANKVVDSPNHPTTGVLSEGVLFEWEDVKSAALGIAETLGFIEYMGFDFGITDKGVRLMEINSHSGLKYIQLFYPGYDGKMGRYFEERIKQINALDDAVLETRRSILR